MTVQEKITALAIADLTWTALCKRKQQIEENFPADGNVAAWCADLSEEIALESVVGTVEVPGERGIVQVQPFYNPDTDYDSDGVYTASRDGQLTPIMGQGAAGSFMCFALLPGQQKWKPTYRHGTITAITNDTANVTLEAVLSSIQNLDINQTTTLSDVPIEYMECNGSAFSIGDNVLIKFEGQSWDDPKIIGFKDHPQPCSSPLFYAQVSGDLWAFYSNYTWSYVADAPAESWLILGYAETDIDTATGLYAMSFDPFVVWKLSGTEWVNYAVPACPYGTPAYATGFSNQPVWTGKATNKFFIRPYVSDYVYRDLLSLDIVNKTWDRQAYFQNSGSRLFSGTGQYNYQWWPAWDGSKQVSLWYELGGAPYWSWIVTTVGYWGNLMPHSGTTQAAAKPGRMLCIDGDIYFCGDADFGEEYSTYPVVKKNGDHSYTIIADGPGFSWGRECCYTGDHILVRNPSDYSVWAFDGSGWEQISAGPGEYWFDCAYAGRTVDGGFLDNGTVETVSFELGG